MKSSGGSGAAVACWPRPGHDLDLPMGEHRTGKTILQHLEREPRTLHPALGAPAAPEAPPVRHEDPAPRTSRTVLNGPALAARYRAGAKVKELAAEHRVNHTRIAAILREQGIVPARGGDRRPATTAPAPTPPETAGGGDPMSAPPTASTPAPDIDPAAIRRLERQHLSNAQIAAELGVPLRDLLAHFARTTR